MNELTPKLFDTMKGYKKEQLIRDIISGIIVAIIALPLSIALAIASGVGPEQGLYTPMSRTSHREKQKSCGRFLTASVYLRSTDLYSLQPQTRS